MEEQLEQLNSERMTLLANVGESMLARESLEAQHNKVQDRIIKLKEQLIEAITKIQQLETKDLESEKK